MGFSGPEKDLSDKTALVALSEVPPSTVNPNGLTFSGQEVNGDAWSGICWKKGEIRSGGQSREDSRD